MLKHNFDNELLNSFFFFPAILSFSILNFLIFSLIYGTLKAVWIKGLYYVV